MASFIFIIAGLNLALGYLLALYLAPELHGTLFAPAPVPAGGPTLVTEKAPVEIVSVAATLEAELPQVETAMPAPVAAAPPGPAPITSPVPAETAEPVGELIDQFKGDLNNYRNQLADVENRMRSRAEGPDVTAMQACLADLFAANARYLSQQEESGVRLQRHCESVEEHAPIGRQLSSALDQQAEQVRGANENLERLDPQDNTPQGCQKFFDETTRLIDASNSLRETLDDVEQQLTGQDANADANPAAATAGEAETQSKLVPREQLDAVLAEIWAADPDRLQPLLLGVVDLDGCGQMNEARGRAAGDRVLTTVGRVVGGSLQGRQLATRLSGEKFLLLLPGRNGRESTGTLELIRQQVETTRFQAGADQFNTSVSCAVVEAVAGDVMDTVLERLETTLQEAKRCGRNRTFFHDGKFPTPVVPPILSLQTRTQEI